MVDVKLDVNGGSPLKPSKQLAGSKKTSSVSVCHFLLYLSTAAGIALIGLDAAQFFSLGIVENYMRLKVMRQEQYDTMTSSLDSLQKELEKVKESVQSKDIELADKNTAVTDIRKKFYAAKTEKATIQQQVDEQQRAIDALTNQLTDEKAKVAVLTTERDALKAAAEAPKAEAPKAEAPQAEAPKAEAPNAEAPNAEAPNAEAPKAEAPKADAPNAEAPNAEAPNAEAPQAEAPNPEAPKAEAPNAEAPNAEAPNAEENKEGAQFTNSFKFSSIR